MVPPPAALTPGWMCIQVTRFDLCPKEHQMQASATPAPRLAVGLSPPGVRVPGHGLPSQDCSGECSAEAVGLPLPPPGLTRFSWSILSRFVVHPSHPMLPPAGGRFCCPMPIFWSTSTSPRSGKSLPEEEYLVIGEEDADLAENIVDMAGEEGFDSTFTHPLTHPDVLSRHPPWSCGGGRTTQSAQCGVLLRACSLRCCSPSFASLRRGCATGRMIFLHR